MVGGGSSLDTGEGGSNVIAGRVDFPGFFITAYMSLSFPGRGLFFADFSGLKYKLTFSFFV